MKKYTDGKRTINATEKAFNLIYSAQGFKEVKGAKTPAADPKNKDNKKDDEKGAKTPEANPENKEEGKGAETK